MSSTVLFHKIVSALPDPLEANSIYYVRVGTGFDTYVTNDIGLVVAYESNEKLKISDIQARINILEQTNPSTVYTNPVFSYENDLLKTVTYDGDVVKTLDYDENDNLILITLNDGEIVIKKSFQYDENSNLISVTLI